MAGLQAIHFKQKKKSSGGPYKGQDYVQIALAKIRDKSQFTIGSKEGTNKVYGISLDEINGKFFLTYTNQLRHSINWEWLKIVLLYTDYQERQNVEYSTLM